MPFVADQDDVVALSREPLGLGVHFGNKRAGGIDGLQSTVGCLGVDLGGDAVGREHHRRALRNLLDLIHEDRTPLLQRLDHVLVVDDLLADVDRGAVEGECLLDRHHGAIHSGAVATGGGQQDLAFCRVLRRG